MPLVMTLTMLWGMPLRWFGDKRAEEDKVHVPCACAMIAAVRRERESIGERRWMVV